MDKCDCHLCQWLDEMVEEGADADDCFQQFFMAMELKFDIVIRSHVSEEEERVVH